MLLRNLQGLCKIYYASIIIQKNLSESSSGWLVLILHSVLIQSFRILHFILSLSIMNFELFSVLIYLTRILVSPNYLSPSTLYTPHSTFEFSEPLIAALLPLGLFNATCCHDFNHPNVFILYSLTMTFPTLNLPNMVCLKYNHICNQSAVSERHTGPSSQTCPCQPTFLMYTSPICLRLTHIPLTYPWICPNVF